MDSVRAAAQDVDPLAPGVERGWLTLLTLLGFALRITRLDRLGLSYDEAATALMSRPAPWDIIAFHWRAPFEHPPLWPLLIHAWSQVAGQSEVALRWLPALAGSALLPLIWITTRRFIPTVSVAPFVTTTLAAISPVLVYYSQEARMYSLVLAAAMVSTLAAWRIVRAPTTRSHLVIFWLTNWVMTGLHYVSALVLAVQVVALMIHWARLRTSLPWRRLLLAYGIAGLPITTWLALAPSFRTTLQVVLREAGGASKSGQQFLIDYWRDTAFAAIRWTIPATDWSLLLAPVFALGLLVIVLRSPRENPGGLFVILLAVLPPLVGALALRTLATRYILFAVPYTLIALALALVAAWQARRSVGLLLGSMVTAVTIAGLLHYNTTYVKSDYRRMATELSSRLDAQTDLIILEAPRQHLLARYYFPATWSLATVPESPDTPYWPITAPRVVPEVEDGRVQAWLAAHPTLWIIYAGENEVDPGEFLAKYVTAVAYRQSCRQYLDVRVCRYVSPHNLATDHELPLEIIYAGELAVERAVLTLYPVVSHAESLLVQLDWHAVQKPTHDLKASIRILAADGHTVAQADELPIGSLLPPTTWGAGDRKPGYMAVTLPALLEPGDYTVALAVYDAATLLSVQALFSRSDHHRAATSVSLAILRVGATMELLPAPP